MAGWTDDPELVAIFRAEVEEKLASLRDGLLKLEDHPAPKQLIAVLFRDAHTVKGSARALALESVVSLAHRAEDLLGALRDGRFGVRRDLVDLLLAAAEGIGRAMPGAERPVSAEDLAALVAALDRALDGEDPVEVPRLTAPVQEVEAEELSESVDSHGRRAETVRVPTRRVHDLLDMVGEAELEARRVERTAGRVASIAAEHVQWGRSLRKVVNDHAHGGQPVPAEISESVHALVALGDRLQAASRDMRGRLEDAQVRLAQVREGAMGMAMVPVRRVVASFPQLVREVCTATGKQVDLVLEGEDVELDTRVLDGVADALKHLVTNAVDHGCETAAERAAAGKAGPAQVRVSARAAGATVVIEVSDNGLGVDLERLQVAAVAHGLIAADAAVAPAQLMSLLFVSGFSTRSEVTETSGRGIGLDVVRTAVEDLGGSVDIETEAGVGTRFVITLPVTLGVMRCLVARLGDERYALPVTNVVETLNLRDNATQTVAGAPVIMRHGLTIPIADLGAVLDVPGQRAQRVAVVVRYGGAGEQLAWAVDALEGELELVVKDLGGFLGRLPAVGGATIDADGAVMFLLDLRELAVAQLGAPTHMHVGSTVSGAGDQGSTTAFGGQPAAPAAGATVARGKGRPRVLVVEDSVGVRELQRVILEGAGYDVITAVDGQDGAARLSHAPVDLVLSDVEMPGMDGFTLTRQIRKTRGWENVPVVIMTSRGDDADKRAGLDAGASAYLLKSEFDQADLVDTVRRLVGR
jgi:chemotaxis protein histidine kinase CheA/CheY-like chemotaxis protein